jgi:CheY-like chemotaxis protein
MDDDWKGDVPKSGMVLRGHYVREIIEHMFTEISGAAFEFYSSDFCAPALLINLCLTPGSAGCRHGTNTSISSQDHRLSTFLPGPKAPALTEKHILLVDDEQDILDLLGEVLFGSGYSVDFAMTLAEAVGFLDSCSYRLVISDWQLPDGDGLLVADTAAVMGAKTILMSGHLSQMNGGRADGHDTVMKPFEIDEFANAVKAAIGNAD